MRTKTSLSSRISDSATPKMGASRMVTPSATPSADHRTPNIPHEISNTERNELRAKLDKAGKYFSIAQNLVSQGKKRKRGDYQNMQLQTDMFQDRLDIMYEVLPHGDWEKLRRYKKFTVGSESIATGECILVQYDDSDEARLDVTRQWKAKVLEVRALDPEHVYIRVSWLNRPEDLDGGRRPHQGRMELVPTNEMDIIDAMTVNGRLEVVHWNEDDDDALPDPDKFFWRQTLNFNTKKFSPLRQICRDKKPQNPDELILQCSSPECRKWLHVKCLAEDAVIEASKAFSSPGKKPTKATSVSIDSSSAAQAKAQKDAVTAEIFIKDLPSYNSAVEPSQSTQIVLSGPGSDFPRTEKVKCLFCQEAID